MTSVNDDKTVFIVEDDRDIQDIVSMLLSGNGYSIDIFGNLSDFNTAMGKRHPDVIVMDVMLPDGNGMEECKVLRSKPESRNIPIILMSANRLVAGIHDCADQFINKPFDINIFKNKVETLL